MARPTPPETPTLPTTASPNGRSAAPALGAAQLVLLTDPRSAAAEAYRTLRTNIQFASLDREVRTIAITSPGAGDGKSTTLANLAIAMAEGGHRVIVVDADLRRPGLHTLFGLANREGLTTAVLSDDTRLPLQDTPVPGLRLLTSGPLPPNPAELVGSRRLDRVLSLLRDVADYVLFDTPPAAALSDAATLAARVDGVILVIGAGRTKRDLARRAKEQLERVKAHILGVVLAGVRTDTSLYAY
jgi:capsular exopolysaccharide synthesis family protein